MHKDLCGQEEYPTEQQLNNILDGMKTSIFRRKLLLYRAAENRFDINWLNIDGEVEDRFAVQTFVVEVVVGRASHQKTAVALG